MIGTGSELSKVVVVYTKGNFKDIELFQRFNIMLLSSKNLP